MLVIAQHAENYLLLENLHSNYRKKVKKVEKLFLKSPGFNSTSFDKRIFKKEIHITGSEKIEEYA